MLFPEFVRNETDQLARPISAFPHLPLMTAFRTLFSAVFDAGVNSVLVMSLSRSRIVILQRPLHCYPAAATRTPDDSALEGTIKVAVLNREYRVGYHILLDHFYRYFFSKQCATLKALDILTHV